VCHQGLKAANKQDIVVPYLDSAVEFIRRSTSDSNRTQEVVKAAVGLLGDLGDAFGARMAPLYSQPDVMHLINMALADENSKAVASWTKKV
jgi:hypothetical protein